MLRLFRALKARTGSFFAAMTPSARRDLMVLSFAAVIAYFYALNLDLFERFIHILDTHEEWEADEILMAFLIASAGALTFAGRRMVEAVHELKKRIALEDEAKALALHDALTGLPNRRKLHIALTDALGQAERGAMAAIVAIDLDRFKPVNDLYGHAAGDALLVSIAKLLTEEAGPNGIVARVGGDEFILVWRNLVDADDLLARLGRLNYLFETPMAVANNAIAVGATIGVAVAHGERIAPAEILRRADIALYRAKGDGRGQFAFFEHTMDEQVQTRLELERELRDAVARDAIEPFFQPLVRLDSGDVFGYEMLARMRDANGGIIPPDRFIPMAEEIGVIGEMTMSLLRRACLEMRDWPGAPLLSVNISPFQLRDNGLPQKIVKVLLETGFPPARLQVEITESALVADLDQARTILTSLRNQGVRISLDDFGTGYSSLRHLRELPFDNLKIDRSFVQTMGTSSESQTIVNTILDLAKNLGLDVTAEGIETPMNAQLLRAFGCRSGQGYWFGRPAEAKVLRERLRENADRLGATTEKAKKGAA